MKTYIRLFALITPMLMLSFCKSKTNKTETVFEKGKVIEKVICNEDKSVNYALYLPSSYDTTKTYPLIITFDSHGDGLIPVKLFKNQAEKYGYIVVGSNNSKNGTTWETTNSIYQSMLSDIKAKFKINLSRIYTSGFSGGSRVASSIAIFNGGIAGVIGFSAGFPNMNQPITNSFDYLGIVGNSDFNYIEMNELDKYLNTTDLNHYLIVFEGKHEWAPEETITDVFYWLEFCAYRKKLCVPKSEIINEFQKKCETQIQTLHSKKDVFGEYLMYQKMISFLNKITDIQSLVIKKEQLDKIPSVKNELRIFESETTKEKSLQQFYQQAMLKNDLNWWNKEVVKINSNIIQNTNKREVSLQQRVLNYLSICGYSYSNNALQSKDLSQANRFISIYIMVDPKNSDPYYFQAELSAMNNDTTNVIKSLDKAIELGFSDINKMQSDANFTKFQSLPDWLKLVDKISKK